MKLLKYSILVVLLVVIGIAIYSKIKKIFNPPMTQAVIVTPEDKNFAPITKTAYRPKSIPFERPIKIPVKFPGGMREADVRRVVIIIKDHKDTTSIIETKKGELFVAKGKGDIFVQEFIYKPPILKWGLNLSIGVSGPKLSPVVAISPLKIYDLVQFPLASIDKEGLGLGVGIQYKHLILALLPEWRFKDFGRQVQIGIGYTF